MASLATGANLMSTCLLTASADQVGGGARPRQGLHLRGVVQADARQVGHRGHRQPEDGPVESADGPHQGDDGRPQSGQRGHQPQAQVVGAAEEGPVQGRHRSGRGGGAGGRELHKKDARLIRI